MMIFVLLLLVQIASPKNDLSDDSKNGVSASKELPGDEKSYRSLPIARSERSLGKVKMSDSYATIARHSANTVTGSRQQESKWLLLTAGDDSRTINSQLEVALSVEEKDTFTAEKAEAHSHGLFSTVSTSRNTSAHDKGYNSIGPQEEEESLEAESDGFEEVQIGVINSSSTAPDAPVAGGPIGVNFWPKCCSMGEILYVPSPPLKPVCELFEGPHLASPSLLQGLGLEWGRDKLSGGLPLACGSGEQVQIY